MKTLLNKLQGSRAFSSEVEVIPSKNSNIQKDLIPNVIDLPHTKRIIRQA